VDTDIHSQQTAQPTGPGLGHKDYFSRAIDRENPLSNINLGSTTRWRLVRPGRQSVLLDHKSRSFPPFKVVGVDDCLDLCIQFVVHLLHYLPPVVSSAFFTLVVRALTASFNPKDV